MSDVTLNRPKRKSKGRKDHRQRNYKAWMNLNEGDDCIFCKHHHSQHLLYSGQPYFFRPKTSRDSGRFYFDDSSKSFVVKEVVSKKVEPVRIFCKQCANDKGTDQVVCYIRTRGVGETVGV